MEYASYLAGERWSDRPECTHPALASLARLVNDLISDDARPALAPMIPSVVGLTGSDSRLSLCLCIVAATSALPIASSVRQSSLAVGLLRCEQLLEFFEGAEVQRARERIREAFLLAPGTEVLGRRFLEQLSAHTRRSFTLNDEALLRTAAIGIADACVADADARLATLLEQGIREAQEILRPALHSERSPVLV